MAVVDPPSTADEEQVLPPPVVPRQRIEFLDAVRGMAALVVALQHFIETQNVGFFRWSTEVFRPGQFGVIVFFLTSGYIIPVSIERYKSVPRFWVGRFFRLYPLYWAITGAAVVLFALDRFGLAPDLRLHWVRAMAANATMAQEFIGQPHVLGQAWTLSYELVFYTMASVMFLTGQARRPARAALFWLAAAVLVGTMPARLLSAGTTDQRLTVLAVAAAAGLVAALLAKGTGARIGAAVLTVLVVLLVANRGHLPWFTSLLFGSMFVGWVMRQWSTGQQSTKRAAAMVGVAVGAIILVHHLHFISFYDEAAGAHTSARAEVLTFLGAYAVFLLALAFRHLSYPGILKWFGQISYSVYLVHGVVLAAVPAVGGPVTTVAVWLAVTLAVSMFTYRFIERPAQDLGRKVARSRQKPDPEPDAGPGAGARPVDPGVVPAP